MAGQAACELWQAVPTQPACQASWKASAAAAEMAAALHLLTGAATLGAGCFASARRVLSFA